MRMFTPARRTVAATAALCVAALVASSATAVAKGPDPSKQSRDFRKAVTVRGVAQHLDALQSVADANGGNRFSGLAGHDGSVAYVVDKLGGRVTSRSGQRFDFPDFGEIVPRDGADRAGRHDVLQPGGLRDDDPSRPRRRDRHRWSTRPGPDRHLDQRLRGRDFAGFPAGDRAAAARRCPSA